MKSSQTIRCLNCHSKLKNKIFNVPKITFFQCSSCQLIQIKPPFGRYQIRSLYSFADNKTHFLAKNPQARFVLRNPIGDTLHRIYLNWYGVSRKKKIEKLKSLGSLLDVGCGNGGFLKIFDKHKWQLFGLEINKSQAQVAQKLRKVKIFTKTVENFKFTPNYFDVVTLWHVFEHLENPRKILVKLHRILKNNGYLLIEVPNGNSIYRKIFNDHWQLLMPPEHLFFWTNKSLKLIINNSGFRIIQVSYPGILSFSPISSFANYLRAIGVDSNLSIIVALLFSPIFLVINMLSFSTRDNLQIIAQKNSNS